MKITTQQRLQVTKEDLYIKLCTALTYIEEWNDDPEQRKVGDAYELLVEIQNNWEEATGIRE